MELDIKEQEAKLKADAQKIGQELAQVRSGINQLEQRQQLLINEALKNQGALDLLKSLDGKKEIIEGG
ncbi:hypothetical protein LCGC14_0392700 [marine sediment metagenome]|uniref:Uncharacterized protein n=1 Tax=marine sediment metagenome TaxID=412755 RepID=A0A0F9T4T0_9ZZZZ